MYTQEGLTLCIIGNTWFISKSLLIESDGQLTFEDVLIIVSCSFVTFNNVCMIV